jgi:hypothetical protein
MKKTAIYTCKHCKEGYRSERSYEQHLEIVHGEIEKIRKA